MRIFLAFAIVVVLTHFKILVIPQSYRPDFFTKFMSVVVFYLIIAQDIKEVFGRNK